jgi:predicted DsbA family dithiol-disulfide isomerase
MRIDIFSDTICPWCFIGKRRLERALESRPQADLSVTWRAFQLNPEMPAEGLDRQAYLTLKFGGAAQARTIYEAVEAAGEEERIGFRFDRIRRTPNTVASHRLLAFADRHGHQDETAEALFRAYFIEGEDIGELETLAEIGARGGLEPDAVRAHLTGADGIDQVLAEDATARKHGILGVPCFILEGRYALSGAQQPAVFHQLFDLVRQEAEERGEVE